MKKYIFRLNTIGLFLLIAASNVYAQTNEYTNKLDDCLVKRAINIFNRGCMNGVSAPDFSAETIDGKKINLKAFKGKVVVLNFWFIECVPCRAEMPELNKIVNKFKDKDVKFISIARENVANLKNYLLQHEFSFETISDLPESVIKGNFHIASFPTTIVIDQKGIIRLFTTGGMLTEKSISKNLDDNLVRCIDECLGISYVKSES